MYREAEILRIMAECQCDRKCAEWVYDHGAASDASVNRDVQKFGD